MELNMISVISHEFKMPLSIISGNVETLERYYKLGKLDELDFLNYTAGMRRNCNRLTKLTNNLIDLIRINDSEVFLNFEHVIFPEKINEMVEIINKEPQYRNLKFNIQCKNSIPDINCDVEKLERIFLNLVSNTFKYVGEDAEITIELTNKDEHIQMQFQDNGPGMPSDKLDKIFEPFVRLENILTAKSEGSGLGLAIVKKFVNMLGGEVKVNNRAGEGFCINLTFPHNLGTPLQVGQQQSSLNTFKRAMEVELCTN